MDCGMTKYLLQNYLLNDSSMNYELLHLTS